MKNLICLIMLCFVAFSCSENETELITSDTEEATIETRKKEDKVLICHNTSSETNPVVMIEVAPQAVDKHMENHGDYEPIAFYPDEDGDGYGDEDAEATTACLAPEGSVDNNFDCDDSDPSINPDAEDGCSIDPDGNIGGDGVDNDCDGEIDERTEEICGDGIDNDCDGTIDELDDCV